jgi:23S rRNA (cytidine1920-2'-O)/16S rRNA (cytidine1409-2'-O)-methyltransferase
VVGLARQRGSRLVPLAEALARRFPGTVDSTVDAASLVASGRVLVDGRPVLNPDSRVPLDASVTIRDDAPLRGSAKLEAALDTFGVVVEGRVALDAGAAAGGFTSVLLDRGARRVYAVDAGHGQLLGSLRQDHAVVNLERTNLGALTTEVVPDAIDVVTLDLSYLALADAVPQLDRVTLAPGADLVALVKPMFELALAEPPSDEEHLALALATARAGVSHAGWTVLADMRSPVLGSRGAAEFLLHAHRSD